MTSRTRAVAGSRPSETARTVMSRSVIMPTSLSLGPQTGSGPTSSAFIFAAASCKVASGLTHSTPRVITSLTSMVVLPGPGPFPRRATSGSFLGRGDLGHVLAQGGGQVDLVLLLVDQDLADVLGHGVLAQGLALPHPLAVVAYRGVLVVQVEAKHLLCVLGRLDRLGRDHGHAAEVVDLFGDHQGVLELLLGVLLELRGDGHVYFTRIVLAHP